MKASSIESASMLPKKRTPPKVARTSAPPFQRAQRRFLMIVLAVSGLGLLALGGVYLGGAGDRQTSGGSGLALSDIPFDGARAYDYLKQLCALERRMSGSPGMAAQQKLLREHFTKLGAQVELQRFPWPHPLNGKPVELANLIVRWQPERAERIVLCTHYDTLPYPLRDRHTPQGKFVGANDGGSGTALLMALGHEMPRLTSNYGVDFVFFDAEEFMFDENGKFFIGSEHFAAQYAQQKPAYRYRWGVLLDMVGDKDLQLYEEKNSVSWPDTRPLVDDIWATAARLGVTEFIPQWRHDVRDDHLALHNMAGIPCCNIIDFDYPYWHTTQDTPVNCSALSLAKVGWVLLEWLKAVK